MKKLAVFGTHGYATQFADAAKAIGVETHLFAHPIDDVVARHFDESHDVSLTETEILIALCREIGISGVVPTSEFTLLPTAMVTTALGLDGNTPDTAAGITSKKRNRDAVRGVTGLCQPRYILTDSLSDLRERWGNHYPFIIKPTSEAGKRGVSVVKCPADLEKAIRYSEMEPNRSGKYIVEEFMPAGYDICADLLSFRGRHYVIQVSHSIFDAPPHCAELGHEAPAELSEEMRARVERVSADILTACGMVTGPSCIEMRIIGEDIYLIEVNGRADGDHQTDIMDPLSTGFPYITAIVQAALGDLGPIDTSSFERNYAGICMVVQQTAYLKEIFDTCEGEPWLYRKHKVSDELAYLTHNDMDHTNYLIYLSKEGKPGFLRG